jgi:hypothetical protein
MRLGEQHRYNLYSSVTFTVRPAASNRIGDATESGFLIAAISSIDGVFVCHRSRAPGDVHSV